MHIESLYYQFNPISLIFYAIDISGRGSYNRTQLRYQCLIVFFSSAYLSICIIKVKLGSRFIISYTIRVEFPIARNYGKVCGFKTFLPGLYLKDIFQSLSFLDQYIPAASVNTFDSKG